ncbi:hypothetical protein V2A60_008656 [Cordyceps javanica]
MTVLAKNARGVHKNKSMGPNSQLGVKNVCYNLSRAQASLDIRVTSNTQQPAGDGCLPVTNTRVAERTARSDRGDSPDWQLILQTTPSLPDLSKEIITISDDSESDDSGLESDDSDLELDDSDFESERLDHTGVVNGDHNVEHQDENKNNKSQRFSW